MIGQYIQCISKDLQRNDIPLEIMNWPYISRRAFTIATKASNLEDYQGIWLYKGKDENGNKKNSFIGKKANIKK